MERHVASERRGALGVALALGFVHAVVDASCLALLAQHGTSFSTHVSEEAILQGQDLSIWHLYLLYNALAFGTQFSIGAFADRWRAYRGTALWGVAAVGAAVAIGRSAPLAAVVIAGLGNAAFHVGAGAVVLRMAPDRAAPSGVFVGPGSLGVAAGAWCGKSLECWPWVGLALLGASMAVVWHAGAAGLAHAGPRPKRAPIGAGLAALCAGLVLTAIAIRSTHGMAVGAVHQDQAALLWGLAAASFAGKTAGGFVADRVGWLRTAVLALLCSAPLLSFLVQDGASAVAGTVLFQMTMPVTLMAVYRVFPREPGLAFGLTTLALLVGVAPVFVLPSEWLTGAVVLLALALVSAAALLAGLPPLLRLGRTVNRAA